MNRKTEKLYAQHRKRKLLETLKSELSICENLDMCITLSKCIDAIEQTEV